MPPLDLSGFVTPEQTFGGLYKAGEIVKQQSDQADQLAAAKKSKADANAKFLTDYLDPKDKLTGTNYDPMIVSQLQNTLQSGMELAGKGASTSDILMALGPSVNKINQYSATAKQINQNIKTSVGKLTGVHGYTGYNAEALQQQALKEAFYDEKGNLKDISTVDPNQDYVTQAAKNAPELVTTGKGLDDFVAKTPMADYSRNVTTAYGGRSKTTRIEAKHPFWMDVKKDANGNVATDQTGAPLGLDVVGGTINGDDGKPLVNPEDGQPYTGMDKNHFTAIMQHNPDVADYIRGQVNAHFKAVPGFKTLPPEGGPQWQAMAQHILGDELQTRDKSSFKTIDQQKETAPAIKVELGRDPAALQATQNYEEAAHLKGDYAVAGAKTGKALKTNAVETVGKIFNNDPEFTAGDPTEVGGKSVIDVTPFFPGGGLKTGRGDDNIYKSIYYDPANRSLMLEVQGKTKDASGQKPTSYEEVPESKAGQFMARIAGANGVDPSKVSGILTAAGYNKAKFTNPANADDTTAMLSKNHAAKVESALQSDNFEELKGVPTKDGTIQKINERTYTSWLPGRDKYSVDIKTPHGTVIPKTFKDKEALTNYIKGGASGSNGVEAAKNKYGIQY